MAPGTAVSPGPQSIGRAASGRATVASAALPIKVSTTRRDRFMMFPFLRDRAVVADGGAIRQGERGDFTASCAIQLLPEKPKACANPPKPPRLTLPESEAPEDELWLDESLPPKKLKCVERL